MRPLIRAWLGCSLATIILILQGCDRSDDDEKMKAFDERYFAGGATTVFNQTSQAFAIPAPNLTDIERHLDGDAEFEIIYVKAPAILNSGLGPIFNHNSCFACHISDGRGTLAEGEQIASPLFLKISSSVMDPTTGGPLPVPGFGSQLATASVFGVAPEAKMNVSYAEVVGNFTDGSAYSLRQPIYTISDYYTDWPGDVQTSPRSSLPVFGRGLLEAISEATLDSLSDPADANQDGISGRVNRVWDFAAYQTAVGRFGWKAGNPSVLQQNAGAFHQDMGLTTSIFPHESSAGQTQDDSLADDYEISDQSLSDVTFYVQTLGVPAPRDLGNAIVAQGNEIFHAARCAACHVPDLYTGDFPVAEVANQKIHPYSDLLLHDMGEGLADGRTEFLADGNEWRTPPLWGIGLTRIVQGQTFFLHDGRARSLEEAILWHGGEAEYSREYYCGLPRADREALIKFLEAL